MQRKANKKIMSGWKRYVWIVSFKHMYLPTLLQRNLNVKKLFVTLIQMSEKWLSPSLQKQTTHAVVITIIIIQLNSVENK